MRTTRYIASLSCATTSYLQKTDEEIIASSQNIDHSLRFFNKNADHYFYHPDILFSAASHASKYPNIRKSLHIDDDAFIFVDSGGYQLSSGALSEKNWNNKLALEWSEKNGNIFPILDRPVTNATSAGAVAESLRLTHEAARYYYENRSVSDNIILNVLSAKNVPEMEQWYETVKDYQFDGWAHGGTNRNFKATLKGMLFLLNKGEYEKPECKYHHVFGVSRLDSMIYFAVVQKELNRIGVDVQIIFDSSYFQRNLAFGGFFLFPTYTGMKQISYSNRYDYSNLPDDLPMSCSCSVCSDIKNVKDWIGTPRDFYMMGLEHNLHMMMNYKKTIDNIINMDMSDVWNKTFPSRIQKNIAAIQKAFAHPKTGYEIIDRQFVAKDTDDEMTSLEEFF